MRDLIVEELSVGAPPERVAQARQLIGSAGNIVQTLVDLGFPPREILQACCAVTGVPPAPLAWLREPKPPPVTVDAAVCRRVGCAPVALQNGKLCIAYLDPEQAMRAQELPLPRHQAYLALPSDLQKAIAMLPLAASDEDEIETRINPMQRRQAVQLKPGPPPAAPGDDDDVLFDGPAEAAAPAPARQNRAAPPAAEQAADAEPLDGATLVMSPVQLDAAALARGLPARAGRADDDEERTTSVSALSPLPSAPKPAKRQIGAVSQAEAAAAAAVKSASAAAPPAVRIAVSTAPTAPSKDPAVRQPTPRAPPAGASIVAAPADTVRTPVPAALRGERAATSPPVSTVPNATKLASATTSSASSPPLAPVPSSKVPRVRHAHADETIATPPVFGDAAAAVADTAVRALPVMRPSSPLSTNADKAVLTASDDRSVDTQQQARAVLSEGDLEDDSDEIDASEGYDLPDVARPPPAPPSRPATRQPARPASSPAAAANASASSAQVKAQTAPSETQFVDPVSVSAGDDDGQGSGAFAAAGPADQEALQNQKQRLKRIAQIASIKRYKIDRVLGRGGMATVYYATDQKTGEPCALKLMEPHLAEDAVFVERFKREIRASISLDHENIVRVFDYGEENGTYYMASEYVDGGTVASLLKSLERPLPVAAVIPIVHGFLDGLQHAHEQGFVHRDLKPANLMFTTTGVIKIGDFGIAKAQTDTTLTKTGALFGTPAYMSPEQAQGQELDTRSDLFGVGIIFYELLSGYNPFAHENPSTTMFAIAKGQVRSIFDTNPTVPLIVERVVHKLLERDKAKRYQSAGEARDDLKAILDLVNHQSPGCVARMLANPEPVIEELSRAQGRLESDRASQLLLRTPPEHAEAAFRYYKATLLDSQNYEAVNGLTQLRADYGFRFTRPDDKQLIELEQSLEKKAEQPALLRRLADLSATHRNLVDMAGFMKRYLRFMPTDTHVQHKLERIIGNDPLAPFSPLPAEAINRTAAYPQDDEMREAAWAASEDEPAVDAGHRSGVRPAATTKNQSNPKMAAVRGGQPAHGGAQVNESSNPKRSSAADKRAPDKTPTPTSLPAVERVPRDSFEAMWFSIRSIIEDTTRSLTGDQGVDAVKEMLKERFLGEGGDLKGAVKGALGKGKDAVADSLLKEEGRAQMKKTAKGLWAAHGRLLVALTVFFLVMAGLTRACSYACSDGKPAATAPKVGLRGQDVDLDDAAKPSAPSVAAPVAAPTAAPVAQQLPAEAKVPTPEELEAQRLLEQKLLADKPAAPVAHTDELAARQETLKKRAKAEPDIDKAIALYTEAVDTDPYAAGARDALLDRARLHMANGNLDEAEADLFRLKRRPDVAAVSADVQSMFDDIAKAKKAAADPPPAP